MIYKFPSPTQASKSAAMVGAYDLSTGNVAVGASNGRITSNMLHPITVEYIESKLKVSIGEYTSFCNNKAGACAEVLAADQLVRKGSNPEDIKFTEAVKPREVHKDKMLLPEHVIEPCENCKVTWTKKGDQ